MDMAPVPRAAAAGDIDEILRLGEYMYRSVGVDVDATWRDLGRSQLESRLGVDLLGWVIDMQESTGSLAACGFVNRSPRLPLPGARSSVRGYVQWVVTDPRSQRAGLASAIMGEILEWAVGERVDSLDLHSSPAARSLYLSLGFQFSPNVDYPQAVLGAPMQWRPSRTGEGPARPSRHVGGDA
ncbi:MAG: GNAT family N-acetyltransferase [Demequinaceae bacterium]|nr:GNAT family N-acetyltransferase [Demequinaceae bacterium]